MQWWHFVRLFSPENSFILGCPWNSRWWFQTCLFSPVLGEDSHFDMYFSDALRPPTRCSNHPSKIFCKDYEMASAGAPPFLKRRFLFWRSSSSGANILIFCWIALPETNSFAPKMDGWKMIVSLKPRAKSLMPAVKFQGVCISWRLNCRPLPIQTIYC